MEDLLAHAQDSLALNLSYLGRENKTLIPYIQSQSVSGQRGLRRCTLTVVSSQWNVCCCWTFSSAQASFRAQVN